MRWLAACLVLLAVACSAPTATESTPVETTVGIVVSTLPTTTTSTAAATAGLPGIGDSMYPNLGNGGYDVEHYALDLQFDGDRLTGVATLTLHATRPLASFYLDLTGLTVTSVTVDGSPAGFEAADELLVYPAQSLAVGQPIAVRVEYEGVPVAVPSEASSFAVGWRESVDGWFAISEPAGADTWFPSNNHPLDKATFVISVTVPQGMVAISTGTLTEVGQTNQGATFRWESVSPVAPYLVALAIGDFEREESTTSGGVSIVNYFDDDLSASDRHLFDRQGEMLDYFASLFGEYPFSEYGAIVLETIQTPVALETQTRPTFGTQILTLGEAVVAHELAHQWFGGSVSVADWSDVWLSEGFATYAQWLWVEHTQGVAALQEEIAGAYGTLSGAALVGSAGGEVAAFEQALALYPPPGAPRVDDLFNGSVYMRGGLTLHALRLEIGDAGFFDLVEAWATTHRYGNAGTNDFLDLVEELADSSTRNLAEQWLFNPILPAIEEMDLRPPG